MATSGAVQWSGSFCGTGQKERGSGHYNGWVGVSKYCLSDDWTAHLKHFLVFTFDFDFDRFARQDGRRRHLKRRLSRTMRKKQGNSRYVGFYFSKKCLWLQIGFGKPAEFRRSRENSSDSQTVKQVNNLNCLFSFLLSILSGNSAFLKVNIF